MKSRFMWLTLLALIVVLLVSDTASACVRGFGRLRGRQATVVRHVERTRGHVIPRIHLFGVRVAAAPCATVVIPAPKPMPAPTTDPKKKPKAGEESISTGVVVLSDESDALHEVNALRVSRGLRPFIRDDGLTLAARAAAAFRARHLIFGHTNNDFVFLPAGASASAAGCAAYHPSFGWLSCCTNDNATFAGAAFVMGADGKRYMHLFIR